MTQEDALKIAFGWYEDSDYPAGTCEYAHHHEAARIIRQMYHERKQARERIEARYD